MKNLEIADVREYVSHNIVSFHLNKIKTLETIHLKTILSKKNPYLFRAKNINIASELIRSILEAFLYSSEEKLFGDFLEELAIFISSKTSNGRKSGITGIDLEFDKDNIRNLVSIKSGPNWGNSSQHKRQETDFQNAVKVLKQSKQNLTIQPVLGICYGKTKTTYPRGYAKIVGQRFWYFLSGSENLYMDIIEPLGYESKKHNDKFNKEKDRLINTFTKEFIDDFCINGEIDWQKLVQFNSGNM